MVFPLGSRKTLHKAVFVSAILIAFIGDAGFTRADSAPAKTSTFPTLDVRNSTILRNETLSLTPSSHSTQSGRSTTALIIGPETESTSSLVTKLTSTTKNVGAGSSSSHTYSEKTLPPKAPSSGTLAAAASNSISSDAPIGPAVPKNTTSSTQTSSVDIQSGDDGGNLSSASTEFSTLSLASNSTSTPTSILISTSTDTTESTISTSTPTAFVQVAHKNPPLPIFQKTGAFGAENLDPIVADGTIPPVEGIPPHRSDQRPREQPERSHVDKRSQLSKRRFWGLRSSWTQYCPQVPPLRRRDLAGHGMHPQIESTEPLSLDGFPKAGYVPDGEELEFVPKHTPLARIINVASPEEAEKYKKQLAARLKKRSHDDSPVDVCNCNQGNRNRICDVLNFWTPWSNCESICICCQGYWDRCEVGIHDPQHINPFSPHYTTRCYGAPIPHIVTQAPVATPATSAVAPVTTRCPGSTKGCIYGRKFTNHS
ncbi:hypothetical protein TWF281_011248 [Arthrobotrys megalospora]